MGKLFRKGNLFCKSIWEAWPMRFCLYVEMGYWFIFWKIKIKFKKTGKNFNIFVCYKNFMSKLESLPIFPNNPLISSTPFFLGKTFHPHFYCQIRWKHNPPSLIKGEEIELCGLSWLWQLVSVFWKMSLYLAVKAL